MYHNIAKPPRNARLKSLYITPAQFERQLKFLKLIGYKYSEIDKIEDKTVIPTFDDAYKDFIENAYPLLEKYGYKGYVFVPAKLVGKYNEWDYEKLNVKKEIMDWEDLRFLVSKGYKIGSHTLTHPDLTKLSDEELKKEIFDSKKILEDKLGVEIDTFCYPYGYYNDKVTEMVKKAGYKYAFLVEEKRCSLDKPYEIGRINVAGNRVFVFLSFLEKFLRF
ncbi:polysaccharide deacetylase [Hydrogenothermus marinus]|uniref:Polysaccharide deacetylase n=2 Tax=Hydrogenothermus marinus TaxID=133270 RepID=A0A3M0BER1_9AQUI|nr:polysaccharide deacetylase [Hydrogenothermus marinus]